MSMNNMDAHNWLLIILIGFEPDCTVEPNVCLKQMPVLPVWLKRGLNKFFETNSSSFIVLEQGREIMRPWSTLLQLDNPLHWLVRLLPAKVEQFYWNHYFFSQTFLLIFKLTFHHLPPLLLRRLVQNTPQVLAEGSACAQLGASALHHLLGGCLD